MPILRTGLLRAFATTVGLLLLLSMGLAHAADEGPLRVGSKRFTESYILAEVLAQTAAPQLRTAPTVRQGLGNTAIVYEALRSGAIDLYAEYTGTISAEILRGSPSMSRETMNAQLAPLGLGAAIPLGFNDGYAFAMRASEAQRLGVRSLSDLAKHPTLKFGLSNEFIGRADGWRGVAAHYTLPQTPTGLDHGLAYDALGAGQVDVIDIYTTDAKIGHLGLLVLEDDRAYFPRYDAIVLYRLDVPKRLPQAWAALQKLEGRINEPAMIAMNARAELQSQPFDVIARDFLAGGDVAKATPKPGFMDRLFGSDLGRLARQHLLLVAVSVGVATLIGVPLAVAVFPHLRLRAVVLGLTGLMQTVPSLALLAVLISALGAIGTLPALIALTLYSLLPIMRNAVTGLADVSDGLKMAGTALGMTSSQNLRLVQLPLALPTLIAGIRTATTIAIGTATIAAFIGAGGFGERIVTGLALNDKQLLLAGAVPAAGLALLSEAVFELLDYALRRRRRVPASRVQARV